MNNMPFPYFPSQMSQYMTNNNIIEEIKNLKLEIANLKERIKQLENKKKNDYLQNEDSLYMM